MWLRFCVSVNVYALHNLGIRQMVMGIWHKVVKLSILSEWRDDRWPVNIWVFVQTSKASHVWWYGAEGTQCTAPTPEFRGWAEFIYCLTYRKTNPLKAILLINYKRKCLEFVRWVFISENSSSQSSFVSTIILFFIFLFLIGMKYHSKVRFLFWKKLIHLFIKRCIKLIKVTVNPFKMLRFLFQINAVLLIFLFMKETWKKYSTIFFF